jgi:predicted dehydrogenase
MGSIGKRHAKNLSEYGVEVVPFDIMTQPINAHDFTVDCAVIATPTHAHLYNAYRFMAKGIPTFIEKPLSREMDEMRFLHHTAVPHMVACNLRFTKAVETLKGLKDQVVGFNIVVRDNNEKRKFYDDPLPLQDIHEFDYIQYALGQLEFVDITMNKNSYDAVVKLENGIQGTIHGGTEGDYERFIMVHTSKRIFRLDIDISDSMYVEEMKYFIDGVEHNRPMMNSMEEAKNVTCKVLNGLNNPS